MKHAATGAFPGSPRAALGLAALLAMAPLAAAQRGAAIPQAYHGTWAYGSPRACTAHAAGRDNADLMLISSDAIGFWEGSYDIVAVRRIQRGLQLDVREHGPGTPDAGVAATLLLYPMGRGRIGLQQRGRPASVLYRCGPQADSEAAAPGRD